ncbi:MAG: orotidine 5'-phosphate decarboxylase / HUMPS family protein [Sulfolobales archaeon]|nr:orotidine 5'-phosphate decarboxylase [Sulfolobales archaeon]MCX8185685.1 orotidine 5'-phosphate decarboxylase [Sulfolobales archaeon]MDW7969628.1 orotidine 5'-phosphate decarboxylase / HUMPS family protein [Sulfolobales archaeon]
MGPLIRRLNELGRPLIQIAMDFLSIDDAVRLIRKLNGLEVDIFEVGTPLIKSEGIKAVKTVKWLVSDSVVLADMKTADTGGLETRLAAENGADAVSVLASTNDEVISSALKEAKALDVDVVVDTIGRLSVPGVVGELVPLGVKIINIHLAIDVQLSSGKTVADVIGVIKDVKNLYSDLIISASGGVKPQHIRDLVNGGVDIIVMGSAVTKAGDPAEIVRQAFKCLK